MFKTFQRLIQSSSGSSKYFRIGVEVETIPNVLFVVGGGGLITPIATASARSLAWIIFLKRFETVNLFFKFIHWYIFPSEHEYLKRLNFTLWHLHDWVWYVMITCPGTCRLQGIWRLTSVGKFYIFWDFLPWPTTQMRTKRIRDWSEQDRGLSNVKNLFFSSAISQWKNYPRGFLKDPY